MVSTAESKKVQVLVDKLEDLRFKAISRESISVLEVSITSSPEKPKNHQSHTVTVKMDNSTVNLNIHRNGNQILVSQYGAGQTTFVAGSGVTLRSASGKLKLTGQYSAATIIAISASEFYIFGDLTA